jgi:WD40 repeat protein
LLGRLEHPDRQVAVSLSADGRLLATAAGQRVLLWDTATGRELQRWDCPEAAPARGLPRLIRLSADGKSLLFCVGDAWASWGVEDRQRRVSTGNKPFLCDMADLATTADGRFAAMGAITGVFVWDVKKNEQMVGMNPFGGRAGGVQALALGADGKTLALANAGEVHITDAEALNTGKRKPLVLSVGGVVAAVAFAPDGKTLAIALNRLRDRLNPQPEYEVLLCDVATGKGLRRFVGHRQQVTAVAFTPDGSAVVSGSSDNTILVWSVRGTGKAPKQEPRP